MEGRINEVLRELGASVAGIDEASVQALCEAIVGARRIVVAGELFQLKSFAMQVLHLGLDVGVMTLPRVGKGDLFLFTSGPGEFASVQALLGQANATGATTFVLTAQAESSAAREADTVLLISAQTMTSDEGAAQTSVLSMAAITERDAARWLVCQRQQRGGARNQARCTQFA